MEIRVWKKSYAIDITTDDALLLSESDTIKWLQLEGPTLSEQDANAVGAHNLNFDGHFGASVFFDVDLEQEDEPDRVPILMAGLVREKLDAIREHKEYLELMGKA